MLIACIFSWTHVNCVKTAQLFMRPYAHMHIYNLVHIWKLLVKRLFLNIFVLPGADFHKGKVG